MNVKRIEHQGKVLALVIKEQSIEPGVHFVTPDEALLQVGFQHRVRGTKIKAHVHVPVKARQTQFMQEALCIQKGRLKVTFFTDGGNYVTEEILTAGDMVLLIQGGHGFEVLEDVSMTEIKMGPYDPASKKNLEERS